MADDTKELESVEGQTKRALLKMPRAERAKVQKMDYVFHLRGRRVERQTRRYWLVSGTPCKLNAALEVLL